MPTPVWLVQTWGNHAIRATLAMAGAAA